MKRHGGENKGIKTGGRGEGKKKGKGARGTERWNKGKRERKKK